MHRSSESIAALAAALAKAQIELTNPEKSLIGTLESNTKCNDERSLLMRRVFRQRSEAYFQPRRTLMLPPCSRPSRPSPGGRAKCAALTATALVGGYDVRAGMEGWAPQGPNKRMRSEERMGSAAGNVSTGQGVFAPWRDARHRLRSATGSREVCEGAY